MQELDAYVVKADSRQVRVKTVNNATHPELTKLGFSFDASLSSYVKDTTGVPEKAQLLTQLRDAGICFSAGREWCPSEVFEYFREQNLVAGKYKRVSWSAPKNFTIQER